MALTELKQPAKADFYQNIKNKMSTLYNVMNDLERLSEDLDQMDAATLDSMSIPASGSDDGLRADLVSLRTMCGEITDFFGGVSNGQTVVPKTVTNKLRSF